MANTEIDPILRKAFRLLHSRNKDSTDQLKALVDELRRSRHGKSFSGAKSLDEESSLYISKRPKLDSPLSSFKSHTPSPTPSLKSESSSRSRKSDESDSDADMNDLAMEIGINCTVCKSFEQTSGNQLVECQECHSLFHQECHKPPVSHQDITDPRLVWYCAKCSRTMKKQSSVLPTSTTTSSLGIRAVSTVGGTSSGKVSGIGSSRPSPSKGSSQRASPFVNLSSANRGKIGSSNSNILNASSSGSSVARGLSSSSNARSNATGPPGANSLLNAERRVHLMKKKAAAKNAERRKI